MKTGVRRVQMICEQVVGRRRRGSIAKPNQRLEDEHRPIAVSRSLADCFCWRSPLGPSASSQTVERG
jgi:hypothetical protein